MGNHHSAHHSPKPRKNVHWKTAGRPAAPGRPEVAPAAAGGADEEHAVRLRWAAGAHDGGAPLLGYRVECNRLGVPHWVRTQPPLVLRPELLLSGLEPPHRYQFRVAALNAVGLSDYSPLSDLLAVSAEPSSPAPPLFLLHLLDATVLENETTEFRVRFAGQPPPAVAWFKDDYEIFSSRRTAIATDDSSSVLVFHQTQASDEGEIRCTATNRSGHAVTRAHLSIECAPRLRYPRQYEDGLLFEVNETVFLKTAVVGKPPPSVEWRHDGRPLVSGGRLEVTHAPKFSVLKIQAARRSDRGEYQVVARNAIGEDAAAFLVTVTAPPEPPRAVRVTRQLDRSVTLDWEAPADDGGCRVGNYVVEYYRAGWDVWLKATASRRTSVTLFDLIEGSEYRFRVKAESPYGMSVPSAESAPVRIPGRPVDLDFLAAESRIISAALAHEAAPASPAPRRKRHPPPAQTPPHASAPQPKDALINAEKRNSFQVEFEAIAPPPLSLSAPDISARCLEPFRALRNAVSSTELLHERAMARFYRALAIQEEHTRNKETPKHNHPINDIPYETNDVDIPIINEKPKPPEILIRTDSIENEVFKFNERQASQDSEASGKWIMKQNLSFDEDYTASTVSSDGEFSEGSLNGDLDRSLCSNDEATYNPRDKMTRHSPIKEPSEDTSESRIPVKPLPVIDPNFIPKPILKRREPLEIIPSSPITKREEKPKTERKSKKDEKMPIFQKITKMPLQKSFPFPKLLKKESKKAIEENEETEIVKPAKITETPKDKITEEGRTVIDYYGSIVKEYGSQKKPAPQLYLNTEELKEVAEKQASESDDTEKIDTMKIVKTKKAKAKTNKKIVTNKTNSNSIQKLQVKPKINNENSVKTPKVEEKQVNRDQKKGTQQIVLKKTERATIVIPIDYQELEKKAKINVRSAIDYTVDLCLLLLAFWVYFFKDERIAIPFLILLIYRQLQETFLMNIPEWFKQNTPSWMKLKTS